jgi:hypothetical protein
MKISWLHWLHSFRYTWGKMEYCQSVSMRPSSHTNFYPKYAENV